MRDIFYNSQLNIGMGSLKWTNEIKDVWIKFFSAPLVIGHNVNHWLLLSNSVKMRCSYWRSNCHMYTCISLYINIHLYLTSLGLEKKNQDSAGLRDRAHVWVSETEITQECWNFLLTLHANCHDWRYMKYSLICIQIYILCIICASRADQVFVH